MRLSEMLPHTMQYETTLKYNPDDFRAFYERWITKSKPTRTKIRRTHLITATTTLAIAVSIILSDEPAIQLVFLSIMLFIIGTYHLIKLLVVSKRLNIAVKQLSEQVASYLATHQNTETMGLKINKDEIQYFENGTYNSTFNWNDLTRVDFRDDHFMLFFGELPKDFTELPKTVLIPKFAVSEDFYNGVLELTKEKNVR